MKHHPKTIPNLRKNRRKIVKKSIKIDKKSQHYLRCAENAKKLRKNAKNEPNMAPRPFQEEGLQILDGLRGPLPADHFS